MKTEFRRPRRWLYKNLCCWMCVLMRGRTWAVLYRRQRFWNAFHLQFKVYCFKALAIWNIQWSMKYFPCERWCGVYINLAGLQYHKDEEVSHMNHCETRISLQHFHSSQPLIERVEVGFEFWNPHLKALCLPLPQAALPWASCTWRAVRCGSAGTHVSKIDD